MRLVVATAARLQEGGGGFASGTLWLFCLQSLHVLSVSAWLLFWVSSFLTQPKHMRER